MQEWRLIASQTLHMVWNDPVMGTISEEARTQSHGSRARNGTKSLLRGALQVWRQTARKGPEQQLALPTKKAIEETAGKSRAIWNSKDPDRSPEQLTDLVRRLGLDVATDRRVGNLRDLEGHAGGHIEWDIAENLIACASAALYQARTQKHQALSEKLAMGATKITFAAFEVLAKSEPKLNNRTLDKMEQCIRWMKASSDHARTHPARIFLKMAQAFVGAARGQLPEGWHRTDGALGRFVPPRLRRLELWEWFVDGAVRGSRYRFLAEVLDGEDTTFGGSALSPVQYAVERLILRSCDRKEAEKLELKEAISSLRPQFDEQLRSIEDATPNVWRRVVASLVMLSKADHTGQPALYEQLIEAIWATPSGLVTDTLASEADHQTDVLGAFLYHAALWVQPSDHESPEDRDARERRISDIVLFLKGEIDRGRGPFLDPEVRQLYTEHAGKPLPGAALERQVKRVQELATVHAAFGRPLRVSEDVRQGLKRIYDLTLPKEAS